MSLFGKRGAFGLDISDHSVEVMELEKKGNGYDLRAIGRVFVPPGIVEDGRIRDRVKLAALLTDLTLHTYPKKIETHDVVLSLPESQVFLHTFQLPKKLGLQEIRGALTYEAEGVIPLSSSEVYFDYQVINGHSASSPSPLSLPAGRQALTGEGRGEGQPDQQEVLYVAVPKDIVHEYLELLLHLKWRAVVLEIQSYALARALISRYNNTGMMVLVDIGAKTTIISVIERGFVRFSTNLAVAGDRLTEEIAHRGNLAAKDAERLKIQGGVVQFPYLEELIGRIASEIRRIIDFATKRFGPQAPTVPSGPAGGVAKVLVTGGSSQVPGLLAVLQRSVQVPVTLGRPWIIAEDSPLSSALLLAEVTGLALRGAEDDPAKAGINLLPGQEK